MFHLKYGEDVTEEFVYKIAPIDQACYKAEYMGQAINSVIRYRKNKRTFVFVCNEKNELVGYINFFPCGKALTDDIMWKCDHIRDDEISPDEITEYDKDENHLYMLSVAIHPDYQGTDVIKIMTKGYRDYLDRLESEGYPITDIMASAVSSDGIRFLERNGFKRVRELSDGNIVFKSEQHH